MRREQNAAYWLLAPTLFIILLVAIYPLGSAFFKSFTDETFASDEPWEFVGFENYVNLLGITFKTLPPKIDQETGEIQRDSDTGKIRYESPVKILPALTFYKLTDWSFEQLHKKAVPPDVLNKLRDLKNREYQDKKEFASALEKSLENQAKEYLSVIQETTKKKSIRYKEVSQFSLLGKRFVFGARNPDFILAIKDTLIFTITTVFLETIIGMSFALILHSKFPGRGVMRALMLVPWAIPTAISSRMWEWMFLSTRAGFFNVIFEKLGLGNGQIAFLQLENWQLPAMIAIDVWKTTPFITLLILAGLQLISASLYEAAEVDGANKFQQFWFITLPQLKPTLAVALVFRTLDALRVFDLFQIVLGESRYSMASFTYYQLIQNRATGYSAASGVIIFIIIFVFAISYIKLLGVQAEGE